MTYHIKKLEELGLVELDHTEMIHGICARFYKKIPAVVNLQGGLQDDMKAEKEVLSDYLMNEVWTGFKQYMNAQNLQSEQDSDKLIADARYGILHMTSDEAREVKQMIMDFISAHLEPKEDTIPWEISIIAYPRKE